MTAEVPDLMPALPELILAVGSMVLLMVGVFRQKGAMELVSRLAVALIVLAFLALWATPQAATTFNGMFVTDAFARFMKTLVLLGSALIIPMSVQFLRNTGLDRFEYPVLIVLATLGMLMMISANDFLALYLGLELQSLCLYVLAAINRDRNRSTEAGLKYFVLGALSSGMLLYGISLIYGFSGSTSFAGLTETLAAGGDAPLGLIVGLVFLIAGLAFKVSAVPFHMWTPDVYEGAPTPVTAFFAAAPKIAAMALFVRAMMGPFPDLVDQWQQVVIFISVASMILGAFAALVQTNIKRLMAYSSIGHIGYALVGLAAGTAAGIQGLLVYMAIYLTMTLGTFAVILSMRHKEGMTEEIADLAGLARTRPGMAAALAVLMFSLAGVPPLAGFFGKWYVFWAAVDAGLVPLALIGLLTSVVGAFYYLRIVKLMYFDEPATSFEKLEDRPMALVMGLAAVVNSPISFLLIYPLWLAAGTAAAALMP